MRPREPSSIVLRSRWYQSGVGVRAERADERTRTADLLQLRVIHQALQGCAQACKCRIPKPLSILWVAACCTVLRSRWYQSGINCTLASTSTKDSPSCWFYVLLRRAPKAPIAMPATAPRFTVGCLCSQL